MSDPLRIKDAVVAHSRGVAGCIDLVRAGKWRFYASLPERHHHFQLMAERGDSTRDFPSIIIILDHGTPAASVCESTIGFRAGGPEMVTFRYELCCKKQPKSAVAGRDQFSRFADAQVAGDVAVPRETFPASSSFSRRGRPRRLVLAHKHRVTARRSGDGHFYL